MRPGAGTVNILLVGSGTGERALRGDCCDMLGTTAVREHRTTETRILRQERITAPPRRLCKQSGVMSVIQSKAAGQSSIRFSEEIRGGWRGYGFAVRGSVLLNFTSTLIESRYGESPGVK